MMLKKKKRGNCRKEIREKQSRRGKGGIEGSLTGNEAIVTKVERKEGQKEIINEEAEGGGKK